MAKIVYARTALTGGTSNALDYISGDDLNDNDMAFVQYGGYFYNYILDFDSGLSESSPDVIAPDTTPGNKRWILINVFAQSQVAKTADYTVTATNAGRLFTITNDGAVGAINITLPSIAAGLTIRGIVVDAQYLKFTAATGEYIRDAATRSASAGYIRAATVGNVITLEATADDWVVVAKQGTWTIDS